MPAPSSLAQRMPPVAAPDRRCRRRCSRSYPALTRRSQHDDARGATASRCSRSRCCARSRQQRWSHRVRNGRGMQLTFDRLDDVVRGEPSNRYPAKVRGRLHRPRRGRAERCVEQPRPMRRLGSGDIVRHASGGCPASSAQVGRLAVRAIGRRATASAWVDDDSSQALLGGRRRRDRTISHPHAGTTRCGRHRHVLPRRRTRPRGTSPGPRDSTRRSTVPRSAACCRDWNRSTRCVRAVSTRRGVCSRPHGGRPDQAVAFVGRRSRVTTMFSQARSARLQLVGLPERRSFRHRHHRAGCAPSSTGGPTRAATRVARSNRSRRDPRGAGQHLAAIGIGHVVEVGAQAWWRAGRPFVVREVAGPT